MKTTLTRDTTWDILAEVTKSITFKSEFRFEFLPDEGTFSIYHKAPNSIIPGEMRYTNHSFIVPTATYNAANWARWVYDRCGDVDTHERNEFFRVSGERIFAPHHGNGEDPYFTWNVDHLSTEEHIGKSPGDD